MYDYCIKNKLVDAALIAKWKKPGYEKLCSTYVINSNNYKFGTTSICRVPLKDRSSEQVHAQDPTTGCMGCASGVGQPRNIFGNKYGQNLAAVQVAREKRMEEMEKRRQMEEEEDAKREQERGGRDGDGDSETDDSDDDDDYGPTPAAGVWAGGSKLEQESERLADGGDDDDYDDDDDDRKRVERKNEGEDDDAANQPAKKLRTSS